MTDPEARKLIERYRLAHAELIASTVNYGRPLRSSEATYNLAHAALLAALTLTQARE